MKLLQKVKIDQETRKIDRMDIDHIFIFTNTNGKIADELISFGLTANESRVHKGQGTMNRTFSFENFFLEIAWVCNEAEITSDLVKPTGLWRRAAYFKNNYAPFGLILIKNQESDYLFERAYKYQPLYFPMGMVFDILQNDKQPNLPWTCRMPFKRDKNTEGNPINHKNKIRHLSKATFEYSGDGGAHFVDQFKKEQTIQFIKSDRTWLTLTFDNTEQGLKKIFAPLQLTINY